MTGFIPYRRKREGKTNYRKRLKMLVSGTTRLVIRKSNKHIVVQFIDYSDKGDKVLSTTKSDELKKLGWTHATRNIPSAYLTGLLAGKKAGSSIKNAIVDLGLQTQGPRLFSAVKGVMDSGIDVACSEEKFPSKERLAGKHIVDYGKSKDDVAKMIETVKNNILKK